MYQPDYKKVVIVAGEESGDAHAASLIREMSPSTNIFFTGIGGQHMKDAGAKLVFDLASYGVTGLTEVIRHGWILRKAFNVIKLHLSMCEPDLLILVDYPGFNLRLAKFAKEQLNLTIIYYISPQVWAWKANRINSIRKYVDHMAVILPFEKDIYTKANVPVAFVGHPLLAKIPTMINYTSLRRRLNLPLDKKIVALLPGSRKNEIEKHLPVMVQAAEELTVRFKHLHFVIPIAKTISLETIQPYFKDRAINIIFVKEQAIETVACSDCVVVASGTASLECALLMKPMCIVYKASLITYIAATKLIKINYLGLCNILQGRMIVPELLQYDYNAHELTLLIEDLLYNQELISRMEQRLFKLKKSLSSEKADCSLNNLVRQYLYSEPINT